MARAREIGATSVAFPALGTGVGGYPLADAARITVQTVRDELDRSPTVEHVTFALRVLEIYRAGEVVSVEVAQVFEFLKCSPGYRGAPRMPG